MGWLPTRKKPKPIAQVFILPKGSVLGHLDTWSSGRHFLTDAPQQTVYVVAILDSHTRLVAAEATTDIRALTVQYAMMRNFRKLERRYHLHFTQVLSDNGSEFASPTNLTGHPVERLFVEMGIEHLYTQPRRPQTNGRIERFWRTMKASLITGARYDNMEEFRAHLAEFVLYYNEDRPHRALGYHTPSEYSKLSSNL